MEKDKSISKSNFSIRNWLLNYKQKQIHKLNRNHFYLLFNLKKICNNLQCHLSEILDYISLCHTSDLLALVAALNGAVFSPDW